MLTIRSLKEAQKYFRNWRSENPSKTIGFVPTMGFLHQGHISLIREARNTTSCLVVSIFVNPAQFNETSDYENYPTDTEKDIEILEKEGVDLLFHPEAKNIYPDGKNRTQIQNPPLQKHLCGAYRPGHFEGVLWIVHLLFRIIQPDRAFFGLKDYQQYLCVKVMAEEFRMGVEVVGSPTVREKSGLALSSRNNRLSPEGKEKAIHIYRALQKCRLFWEQEREKASSHQINRLLGSMLNGLEVEYAGVFDPLSLEPMDGSNRPKTALIAAAVWIEGIRLIDNVLVSNS